MKGGSAIVHAGPASGAAFTEYTAELGISGELGSTPGQRFFFVIEGTAMLEAEGKREKLRIGGYAYVAEGTPHHVKAAGRTRLVVIEKPYEPVASIEPPRLVTSSEDAASSHSFGGTPDIQTNFLLPDIAGFDFAVNLIIYRPGAAMSSVQTQTVEQGLMILEGCGIYRLDDSWYSVTAGDFIWIRPFCPQWFGVIGKAPVKFLTYQSRNSHPLYGM